MVVDDAIVVLENIVRRRSEGMGARAAAVLGTQQVFFAVIATTTTLAAVFIPLSFLPGQTGGLFREFGFTLAISVAAVLGHRADAVPGAGQPPAAAGRCASADARPDRPGSATGWPGSTPARCALRWPRRWWSVAVAVLFAAGGGAAVRRRCGRN